MSRDKGKGRPFDEAEAIFGAGRRKIQPLDDSAKSAAEETAEPDVTEPAVAPAESAVAKSAPELEPAVAPAEPEFQPPAAPPPDFSSFGKAVVEAVAWAAQAPEAPRKAPVYRVAVGQCVTSRKGLLSEGTVVDAKTLGCPDAQLDVLVKAGALEKS